MNVYNDHRDYGAGDYRNAFFAPVNRNSGRIEDDTFRCKDDEDSRRTMMEPGSYQILAARTLWDKPARPLTDEETMIIWNAIGLAGEAGEVVDTIKKAIFHQHGINKEQLVKELGDVLWYVAALCTKLGINMGDVMDANITKLMARYPEGFSTEDSRGRVEYGASEAGEALHELPKV